MILLKRIKNLWKLSGNIADDTLYADNYSVQKDGSLIYKSTDIVSISHKNVHPQPPQKRELAQIIRRKNILDEIL